MAAPPERVYAALATLGEYPTWWPQVYSVEQVTQETAVVRIRSVLPYTLQLVLTREVEDRAMGLLRVRIRGDLSGWSQWEVLRAGVASRQPDRPRATVTGTPANAVPRPWRASPNRSRSPGPCVRWLDRPPCCCGPTTGP